MYTINRKKKTWLFFCFYHMQKEKIVDNKSTNQCNRKQSKKKREAHFHMKIKNKRKTNKYSNNQISYNDE